MDINALHQAPREYPQAVKSKAESQEDEKTTQAGKKVAENAQGDAYIKGDVTSEKAGIYKFSRDADGKGKILFDDPTREQSGPKQADMNSSAPDAADGLKENQPAAAPDKAVPGKKEEEEKKTQVSTDEVDREIEKLKAKQQSLSQRIGQCADTDKKEKLEQELATVEAEIASKDNDTYRRQHAKFTEVD